MFMNCISAMREVIKMKRLFLVTGASGHLGNILCRKLCSMGESVRALVLPGDPAPALEGLQVEKVEGDLLSPQDLDRFLTLPEDTEGYLFHLAGLISIFKKVGKKLYDVNVVGTKRLLEAARCHRIKRFLYTSSVHAIPEKPKGEVQAEVSHFDPALVKGAYAKTKAEATQAVLDAGKAGMDVVVVHPSGIIGPLDFGDGHLTRLVFSYANRKIPVSLGGGYDFVDARDVADGMIEAMEKGRSGETYILSGHYASMDELFGEMAELTNRKRFRVIIPLWFAAMYAGIAELFAKMRKRTPLYTRYSIFTLGSNGVFTHAKASRELGYKVRPLRETLKDSLLFVKKRHRLRDLVIGKHKAPNIS